MDCEQQRSGATTTRKTTRRFGIFARPVEMGWKDLPQPGPLPNRKDSIGTTGEHRWTRIPGEKQSFLDSRPAEPFGLANRASTMILLSVCIRVHPWLTHPSS